jgi:AcrR family transcriptional regulator
VLSKPTGGRPEYPDELAQLPHGRHGLPQEFVEHNQRQRLIVSFIHLVGEEGYNNVTIARTTAGARVSSRTFYEYFETIEDCYLSALDQALAELGPLLLGAFESEAEWPRRIRAALAVLLEWLARDPATARLLTAEPFVAGAAVAERYRSAFELAVPYMRQGRERRDPSAEALPESTERGLLGGVNSLVSRHAFGDRTDELPSLLPDLVQFLLTPYLGPAEARRVALEP